MEAASKQREKWDFEGIQQRAGKKGIEWHLVPTVGQHFISQAERMIRILKKQLRRSLQGNKFAHKETCRLLQEAGQIVNSRPIAGGVGGGEPLKVQ